MAIAHHAHSQPFRAEQNRVHGTVSPCPAAPGSFKCTDTYEPGSNSPVGFSTSTSTSRVREVVSMALELRTTSL